MRKAILLLCALCSLSPVFAQQDADEVIFNAMRDEMKRNQEQLALPGMQKPFFMSYAFGHYRQFEVVGILGSVVNSYEVPAASVGAVQLLLGDYAHTSDGTYAAPMTQCSMPAPLIMNISPCSRWRISRVVGSQSWGSAPAGTRFSTVM